LKDKIKKNKKKITLKYEIEKKIKEIKEGQKKKTIQVNPS